MIAFGPVPSRRLGKSMGINNIPLRKVCSYSCIYCQLGARQKSSIAHETFYEPQTIRDSVKSLLGRINPADKPDFLTFVASGEPTLDANLGKSIRLLKGFNIPIAVITNASLLSDPVVRENLMDADWVSVKVDAVTDNVWRRINRPHPSLTLNLVMEGMQRFAADFKGTLVTETMMLEGFNDSPEVIQSTAEFILQLKPSKAYIAIPTRPPAVSSVKPAGSENINMAYQIFRKKGLKTELILGFEGKDTGYTGNAENDILNISSVHPLREDAMDELLRKDNADFSTVEKLIREGKLIQLEYEDKKYYIRYFR